MSKSAAERKRDQRLRDKKAGIIEVHVKIHKSKKAMLDAYVKQLQLMPNG
jgi:hypothetical protein